MSHFPTIATTICATLAILAVLSFCSSHLIANAIQLHPHNMQSPPGFPYVLKIGSTVFDRAVEVWKIFSANTSKLPSQYLGIGCNIYSHLKFRPLPPTGNLPPRMVFNIVPHGVGICISAQPVVPFHTIALRCDPNQCETNSIIVDRKAMTVRATDIWNASQNSGPVSWKFVVLGRINNQPDMAKISLTYSDKSNKVEFNIINASITYDKEVYFCNQAQCIPDFVAIRSLNNPALTG